MGRLELNGYERIEVGENVGEFVHIDGSIAHDHDLLLAFNNGDGHENENKNNSSSSDATAVNAAEASYWEEKRATIKGRHVQNGKSWRDSNSTKLKSETEFTQFCWKVSGVYHHEKWG